MEIEVIERVSAAAAGQAPIFIVSDLHFGDLPKTAIDEFLGQAEAVKPAAVLCAGDLTLNSAGAEFALVDAFFSKLDNLRIPLVRFCSVLMETHHFIQACLSFCFFVFVRVFVVSSPLCVLAQLMCIFIFNIIVPVRYLSYLPTARRFSPVATTTWVAVGVSKSVALLSLIIFMMAMPPQLRICVP